MLETFIYWALNVIGYRKFYYDLAFSRGINLTSFEAWIWRPKYGKGSYRETTYGWKFCGYGIDK